MTAGVSQVLSPISHMAEEAGGVAAGYVAHVLVGGTVSAVSGGKFANGAMSASFEWAFGRIESRMSSEGDTEPDGVSDKVVKNRRLARSLSVKCDPSGCDVTLRATIGADETITDETLAWAARDITLHWAGSYTHGDQSYRVMVHLTIGHQNPDIIVSMISTETLNDLFKNGSKAYPAGAAFLGYGRVLELGRYGRGTAAHEFGHLLGLSHQHNASLSIMSYAHNMGKIRVVTGADVDRLARSYQR